MEGTWCSSPSAIGGAFMFFKRLEKYDADKSMFEIDTRKPEVVTDFHTVVSYAIWLWVLAVILALI